MAEKRGIRARPRGSGAARRASRSSPPTRAACGRLLVAHGVPAHIRRHSRRVAGVARLLAEGVRAGGDIAVDVTLAEAAAMLHDIAKAACMESRLDHAAEGGRILRRLGLDGVADIVERHVHLGAWDPAGPVTEAEIVNYADKRVRFEEVVSLETRFRDLLRRYGRSRDGIEARIRENWAVMEAVELKIFSRLPIEPAQLALPARRPGRGRGAP